MPFDFKIPVDCPGCGRPIWQRWSSAKLRRKIICRVCRTSARLDDAEYERMARPMPQIDELLRQYDEEH